MRPLIAITCLAILGAIGYFGWGEWSRAQAAGQAAEWAQHRQSCLYDLANIDKSENNRKLVDYCIEDGYLTQLDLAR